MRLLLCLFLVGCGGGGTSELRVTLTKDGWSVPTTQTALVLPAQIQSVRLGEALKEFGLRIDGNTIILLCEGRTVDPAEGGIPSPAEILVTLRR